MKNIIQSIASNESYHVALNNVIVEMNDEGFYCAQFDRIKFEDIKEDSIVCKAGGYVIEFDTKDGFHYELEMVKKVLLTEPSDPRMYTYADLRLYSYMFQVDDFETTEEWIDYILEAEKYQMDIITKEQMVRAFINMYVEVVGNLRAETIKIFMDKLG